MVFTHYQCPTCKITDPALERLIASDPRVQVMFRDWPIFGEDSKFATRAALAACRHGDGRGLGTPVAAYLIGPYLYEGGVDNRHLAQAVKRARAAVR